MARNNYLAEIAAEYGLELDENYLDSAERYSDLLLEWNEKINLTAITEPQEIAVKHFLDSLLLLKAVDIKENASLIDVGTGAGFPSLPCKLYRRDLKIVLLDALNKRIGFLNEVVNSLGLENASAIHGRAEECGHDSGYRERFDVATARAVAKLRELCEYCLPLVKVGGYFAALKSGDIDEEVTQAESAIKLLGGDTPEIKRFTLPDGSERSIVLIKKKSQTATKYPRNQSKIKTKPL